jgi:hypothetical protein
MSLVVQASACRVETRLDRGAGFIPPRAGRGAGCGPGGPPYRGRCTQERDLQNSKNRLLARAARNDASVFAKLPSRDREGAVDRSNYASR